MALQVHLSFKRFAVPAILLFAALFVFAVSRSWANDVSAKLKPGGTYVMPSTASPRLELVNLTFRPAVTIDASNMVFQSIIIRNSTGIIIKNGAVIGPGGRSYGVHVDGSNDVTIRDMTISGAHRGLVVDGSSDIEVADNQFKNLISDGINVANSRKVLIKSNSCAKFTPTRGIYDSDGKLVKDGDHPDCIQAWSRPNAIVSDIRVIGNRATGTMQGIYFGNHIRGGVDDGGYDRIVIRDNYIKIDYPNGIFLKDARASEVVNNEVHTIPGSVLPNGKNIPVKAKIATPGSGSVLACGNISPSVPNSPATRRCPR